MNICKECGRTDDPTFVLKHQLCGKCYHRRWNAGTLKLVNASPNHTPQERYDWICEHRRRIVPGPLESSCWEYTGATLPWGYGQIGWKGKRWALHRWVLTYIIYPEQKFDATTITRHKCDNPACFRPEHLTYGTTSDNSVDMVLRGRQSVQKLNPVQVRWIREMHAIGQYSLRAMAKMFQVSKGNINHITQRRNWKHVPQKAD